MSDKPNCLLPENPTEEQIEFAEEFIFGYQWCQSGQEFPRHWNDIRRRGYATRYEQEQLQAELTKDVRP